MPEAGVFAAQQRLRAAGRSFQRYLATIMRHVLAAKLLDDMTRPTNRGGTSAVAAAFLPPAPSASLIRLGVRRAGQQQQQAQGARRDVLIRRRQIG
ncbi:MAG TPA: hypothetical protein VGE73_10245 [Pseudolabrys sp.]